LFEREKGGERAESVREREENQLLKLIPRDAKRSL